MGAQTVMAAGMHPNPSAGYELGTEQNKSLGSAQENIPLPRPQNPPAGWAEAPLKQEQVQVPLPRGSGDLPCAALPPSCVTAATKPALPPCPCAGAGLQGWELAPLSRSCGFPGPAQGDGQQISVLQQMPRAVSRSPGLPAHLHQGEAMAGASPYGATFPATVSLHTSLIASQGALG